jgi:DNA gyrase subunit A
MNLKQMLSYFLQFREEVVIQRTLNSLADAKQQSHKLWGLALAIGDIDKVIECIKNSSDPDDAEKALQRLLIIN